MEWINTHKINICLWNIQSDTVLLLLEMERAAFHHFLSKIAGTPRAVLSVSSVNRGGPFLSDSELDKDCLEIFIKMTELAGLAR